MSLNVFGKPETPDIGFRVLLLFGVPAEGLGPRLWGTTRIPAFSHGRRPCNLSVHVQP